MAKRAEKKIVEAEAFLLKDETGHVIAALENSGLGTGCLRLYDREGNPALECSVSPDGQPALQMRHHSSGAHVSAMTLPDGGAQFGLGNGRDKTMLTVISRPTGESIVILHGDVSVNVIGGNVNIIKS